MRQKPRTLLFETQNVSSFDLCTPKTMAFSFRGPMTIARFFEDRQWPTCHTGSRLAQSKSDFLNQATLSSFQYMGSGWRQRTAMFRFASRNWGSRCHGTHRWMLAVRTLTFCQRRGIFPIKPLRVFTFSRGAESDREPIGVTCLFFSPRRLGWIEA